MSNRRSFLLSLVAGVVALGVVVGSAIADELLGVLTKVDVEGKKVLVLPKGEEKETEITVTGDTEIVYKKEKSDLESLDKIVKKAQDAGKKGAFAKVTHEKGKASKIEVGAGKKKAAPPSNER
jgi:hypothetical protein